MITSTTHLVPSTWDVGIFFLMWALGFFWSVSQGTRLVKTAILGVYVSLVIVPVLALERVLLSFGLSTLLGYGISSMIMFAIVTYFLTKGVRPDISHVWWKGFFLSAVLAGFFIFFLIHQIPSSLMRPSAIVSTLTVGTWQEVFWAIVPLVGIVIF